MSFKPYMIFKALALATVPLLRRLEIQNCLGRWQGFYAIRTESFDRRTKYFLDHAIRTRYISAEAVSRKLDTELCEEQKQCVYAQEVNSGNLAAICNLLRGHCWDMLEELSSELFPSVVIQVLLEI